MRIFMGHWRTICNCDLCAINCRFIPGYLLPEDLDYIATFLGYSKLSEFGKESSGFTRRNRYQGWKTL